MRLGSKTMVVLIAGGAAAVAVAAMMAGESPSPQPAAAVARRGAAAQTSSSVADLKLEVLDRSGHQPREPERDPFRFGARRDPVEAAPAPDAAPRVAPPPPPPVPQGPPPPPPIPLRFIGLVDAPTQAGRIAILSDGRGSVLYGKEGETIEGRYRVLRVTPDMVELSHIDGQGRQTIRLTGQ